jgi:hypothetical protein
MRRNTSNKKPEELHLDPTWHRPSGCMMQRSNSHPILHSQTQVLQTSNLHADHRTEAWPEKVLTGASPETIFRKSKVSK